MPKQPRERIHSRGYNTTCYFHNAGFGEISGVFISIMVNKQTSGTRKMTLEGYRVFYPAHET